MRVPDSRSLMTFTSKSSRALFVLGLIVLIAYWLHYQTADIQVASTDATTTETQSDNQAVEVGVSDKFGQQKQIVSTPEDTNPKVRVLAEILGTGNDNDPRLDSEFKSLSDQDKQALRTYYQNLKLENRNGRGTAVFLLGRNLETKEDMQFMIEVLSESPCLSLSDCSMAEAAEMSDSDEHGSVDAVTLVYPQIVAIKGLERASQDTEFKKRFSDQLESALKAASENPSQKVRQAANGLVRELSRNK